MKTFIFVLSTILTFNCMANCLDLAGTYECRLGVFGDSQGVMDHFLVLNYNGPDKTYSFEFAEDDRKDAKKRDYKLGQWKQYPKADGYTDFQTKAECKKGILNLKEKHYSNGNLVYKTATEIKQVDDKVVMTMSYSDIPFSLSTCIRK